MAPPSRRSLALRPPAFSAVRAGSLCLCDTAPRAALLSDFAHPTPVPEDALDQARDVVVEIERLPVKS